MEVKTPRGSMFIPQGRISVSGLISKLERFYEEGTGITERTRIFVGGEEITDRETIIEENSSVVFQNDSVKVIKAVGSVVEVEVEALEDETVASVIERALATEGQTIVFSDAVQVLDYSQTPQIIYTSNQLNEKVRKNAILKIIPFGKDTSGC